MGEGIDYGRGQTNIDRATGIRYGVIPVNALGEWAMDEFEPDYGPARCPQCGGELAEYDDDAHGHYPESSDCCDYACEPCERIVGSDRAFADEADSWGLTSGGYDAFVDCHNDAFVLKSPYYTHASFCSPCAPGACYLLDDCPGGAKAYCLGHEWFEGGRAPYPVYEVATGNLVVEGKRRE